MIGKTINWDDDMNDEDEGDDEDKIILRMTGVMGRKGKNEVEYGVNKVNKEKEESEVKRGEFNSMYGNVRSICLQNSHCVCC
jgi:hypothetical protein